MTAYPDPTSEYVYSNQERLDLGKLSDDRLANIRPVYASPASTTVIYSATRYGKRYILKGLAEGFRNDPIRNLALSKEFGIGIALDHPHIRQTIGYERVDGLGNVIVLEYFDGEPLSDYLKTKRLSRADARAVARQLASALGYIHSKRTLHRDLKPANVLISFHAPFVKIIDFNLSDSDSFVIFKNPAGTERYMAPELKDGVPSSEVSDIYSLGMIISDLASASGDPELAAVGRRCTVLDPAKRPQSVDEIAVPRSGRFAIALSRILYSKITTIVVAAVACLLLAALAFCLLK